MNVYVTPPGVPGAPSTGTGTPEDPFTSVADGIKAAQNGGTVHLHGGHYVESVELEAVSGLDEQRIVVQPFGDGEVFIDSLLPEFLGARTRRRVGPGHATRGDLQRRVRVAEAVPGARHGARSTTSHRRRFPRRTRPHPPGQLQPARRLAGREPALARRSAPRTATGSGDLTKPNPGPSSPRTAPGG